jgi:hypothetical protein
MSDGDQSPPPRDDEPAPGPPRGALVALLVVVVLIGAVMFVMNRLNQAGKLQDCVASGRTNCAPIEPQHQ